MSLADWKHQAMILRESAKLKFGMIDRVQDVTVNGVTAKFHVENGNEYFRTQTVAGERAILSRFLNDLCKTDVVWDVGAAVGTYSCFAGRAGASVVPFEPHPENARRLRQNIQLNQLSTDVRELALSDQAGQTSFVDTGGLGAGTHHINDGGEFTVEQRRGDDVTPNPDVVKIDVEGHELAVLEGMEKVLSGVRIVFVECHPQHDVVQQEVAETLEQAGFTTERLQTERTEPFLRAIKKNR